jgi:tetratricopeptide (TPR) repeat protein
LTEPADSAALEPVGLPDIAAGAAPTAAPAPDAARAERLGRMLQEAADHETAGRLDAAETLLRAILTEAPERHGAVHLLGVVTFRKGRAVEAAALMEQSLALAPTVALYSRNLCELYRVLGRLDEALVAGRRAAALAPDDPHCHHNLSVLHYHRLELDAAIAGAERALALAPDFPGAHFGIAEAALLKADFARGWEQYEWRFRLAGGAPLMPVTDKPQWDGTKLPEGTLLLIADQGYGDVIQFARYIPWAAERASDIALACSVEMQPIVRQLPGIRLIFDHWDRAPDFVTYCPLSGLPRLAGTTLETIPAPVPYLRADPPRAASWRERLDALVPAGYRRIGIVWAGRPTHRNDRNRSAALADLAPLGELPRTALLALQKGPGQAQISAYWGRAPLVNLGPEMRDFGDTMAILDALDLVVAVDTAIVHLAGAMGKPVWVMLPYAPDWRWLLDRGDSPWYPSTRLFRQSPARAWAPVVAAIAAELG